VTTAASGRLFRKGLLIKDATALERLAEVDTVVFDKTGTLTAGTPKLDNADQISPETLSVARALTEGSSHPLSRALVTAAVAAGGERARVTDMREAPGYGLEGELNGTRVRLGRGDWVGATRQTAGTATWLKIGDAEPQVFTFSDALRPGAAEAVAGFQSLGLTVKLVSGDSEAAVAQLAQEVGITDWVAGATPVEKAGLVSDLASEGRKVLMVGDGLNDTAALSAAHISISPASALDAARVASDIVLLGNDLSELVPARETAQKAIRRIRENFQIATVYNIIAVPLAVAGMATPLIAALAMSTSSSTVSLNALRVGARKAPNPAPKEA
jgi:Cu2+-exporting ATPase